jgi:hypothetical protein
LKLALSARALTLTNGLRCVRPPKLGQSLHPVRWSHALRIAGAKHSGMMVAGLGFALALVAHDLALPLFAISVFGLFDRFVGEPFIRSRASN